MREVIKDIEIVFEGGKLTKITIKFINAIRGKEIRSPLCHSQWQYPFQHFIFNMNTSPVHQQEPVGPSPSQDVPPGMGVRSLPSAQEDSVQMQLLKLQQEVFKLREEKERENQRWSEEDMNMIDDREEVDDPKILDWSAVLKPVKVEAMTETGIGLCSLLAVPPHLSN